MTQRTKDTLKIVLPFIGTIFLVGAAWRDIRHTMDGAVPVSRFEADSIRTANRFDAFGLRIDQMIQMQTETNARLREICEGIRTGCR